MKTIDILHVEDDRRITEALGKLFKSRKISYYAVSSIEELDDVLEKAEARVYVIDDRFLDKAGGSIGLNYVSAIESIQQRNPTAPIILFASSDLSKIAKLLNKYILDEDEIAKVEYINKKEIRGLPHKIYEILGYFSQKRQQKPPS